MANLRIKNVQVVDSSNITVAFTANLTSNLITSNISILANTPNVPNSEVLEIKISQNMLSIVCQPLTPLASYFLQFQSVSQHPFESLNGDAIILMDGVSNVYVITAPLSPDNPVINYLGAFFNGNIYNIDDPNSVVGQYINSLAVNLSRALYDIRQLKNENYLELDIVDEQKVRGSGPFDRLLQEGAYEISRVGKTPTKTNASAVFPFVDDFPYYPITLQRQIVTEILTPNSLDLAGTFDINSLIMNLSNSPVTRVDSVVFTLATANPIYTYNIAELGYQIQNSRYDQDFGFSYQGISDSQIILSNKILSDPLFSLDSIINLTVQYEYKNEGIIVDPTSVEVTTILTSIREVLPPIINVFNLQHAPITDTNGNVATINGVIFTDPNQATPGALHPAFITEIPFRLNALPSSPGVYSIDYSVGQVYVYGANLTNDGTGPYPPLATYNYLFTYRSEQDYVYDDTSSDLVALPSGNLINNSANISFNYQQVFIPGIDYNAELHIEALEEPVLNNLVAFNVIKAQNSPITNVFQIFNQTTGEIYTLSRWYNNLIYFTYNNPPNTTSIVGERATFNTISNELLFVNTTFNNSSSLIIFKFFLNNNTIVAGTEDTIASSLNTSLVFADGNVFKVEKWFSREFDEIFNTNRLLNVGEYMVDYINGIAYVAVSSIQGQNVNTVSYKQDEIVSQFPHILNVSDIYYQISPLLPKNAEFAYTNFTDTTILPAVLNPSDELYLNNNATAPYQILNGSIGIFLATSFLAGVTYQVKSVRSVVEYSDLFNSTHSLNFASVSSSNGFNITVSPIINQVFDNVQFDGNYFITLDQNIPYLSSNITYTFSVKRVSDNAALWNSSGVIVPGNPLRLNLPGTNSPQAGDLVMVNYSFSINDLSRVVIDYNKGDFFVDYTYLADELLISYEYGDNVLDFRQSQTISTNDQYYVSYKAGALRDALIKNFGTLVNIPILANVDLQFDRQRYREALQAALSSFIQGPTIAAIKNIGKTISHIEPQVIESAFESWTLGQGLLNPEPITTTGEFQLLPAKFGNGVLISQPDQTISFPTNSNVRLEEGTFETWVLPQWNGLDNNAELTFNILKDGYVINPGNVFIGASEYHPTITTGTFSIDKNSNTLGKPNTNKDGVFIYYDEDISGDFLRWYVQVIDGYVSPTSSNYKFVIKTTGSIYDNKTLTFPKPNNLTIFTGTSNINFSITGGAFGINEGITFLSDPEHYFLDFGKKTDRSRLSIYKDASGYLNFRVIDKNKRVYSVSANVSSWQVNQPHFISASWKLNTRNNQDEIHLFIDGFEVPNIIRYGQKLQPYLHQNFRTIDAEEIVGFVNRDIVGSHDLNVVAGSNVVSSSINFSSFNILVGDPIFINEIGFSPSGYIINNINGQTLTLNTPMPLTLPNNGRFSVNQTNFFVTSDINVVPAITISTIHTFITGTDITGLISTNSVSSALTNFTASNVLPGFMIKIDTSPLATAYNILQVSNHTLIIDGNLPAAVPPTTFQIYPAATNLQLYTETENELPGVKAVFPDYSISQDANFNNILTIMNGVLTNDLIILHTLGINNREVKKQYYVWSSGLENILMTQLPSPINLNQVLITKIILPLTSIGSTNSTLIGGVWVSNNLPTSQPTNNITGRTISVVLSGTNVDFTTPTQVSINGVVGGITVTEILSFSDYGSNIFPSLFTAINYIQVNSKPINSSKSAAVIQVRENLSMTKAENTTLVPIVRYSYPIGFGNTLQNDGYIDGYTVVRDINNQFSADYIGNYLFIKSPSSVAGYYFIVGVSSDLSSLDIQATNSSFPLPLVPFTGGIYQILNTSDYRSGLQNGFFTMEIANQPGQPYLLSSGFYELEYATYASIKFDPINDYCFIGSDFMGDRQANSIVNQMKIYSIMLTDTRIGETIPANQRSITKDFNSLKPLMSDPTTLMLVSFNDFPFTNSANFYITPTSDSQHFLSSVAVNDNFGQSIVFLNTPLLVPNEGILDTKKEGTIEFWLNPLYDTANDPQDRTYFDAYGAVVENVVSVSEVSVKVSGPASQILSVKLQAGDQSIDYFAGGKLEIDTQRAIQEETVSLNANTVVVSQPILQVITVKLVGDFTNTDYFAGGSIGPDQKTIYLGRTLPAANLPLIITYQSTINSNTMLNTQVIRLNRKLPNQNTPVVVNYLPQGLQGDRLRLFKDKSGYINFNITASGTDFVIRAPTRWAKNTWHRIKASYKLNSGIGTDEMRLFLDGYQWNDVRFGTELFGTFPLVMGGSFPGDGYSDGYSDLLLNNIIFKDPINDLFIGTDYARRNPVFSLIDNFRISNISRPIYAPYGEPIDVNYTSNLEVAFPVTQDLYTTYLMDFNTNSILNTNFATIKNRETGNFEFTVNILDSLGIVSSSILVKESLQTLLSVLKPANALMQLNFIE